MMVRISAMMFLQYWPLGVWGVTIGTYIGANTGEHGAGIFSPGFIGYSTAASAIGSLFSPLVVGFLSDRYVAAQKLVSLTQVGCAIAVWGMYASRSQVVFFLWLLVYFQCFVPAATLTNKISLKQLANPDAEYPLVRFFGTMGWIAAGLFVGILWPTLSGESIEATSMPLMLGGIGNVVMALFAITLPDTPPESDDRPIQERAWRQHRVLFTNLQLVAFLAIATLACVPSMAYNNFANPFLNYYRYPAPAALMTLGQLSDLICLTATPWLIARFGLRSLFATGVFTWTLRYVLLAGGSYFALAWPVVAAILIHGPCYVFVYVVGVMYTDHLADPSHRGAAQGLFALASTGIGHLLGAITVGFAQSVFLTPAGVEPPSYNWTGFWLVPALIGSFVAVSFLLSFKLPRQPYLALTGDRDDASFDPRAGRESTTANTNHSDDRSASLRAP